MFTLLLTSFMKIYILVVYILILFLRWTRGSRVFFIVKGKTVEYIPLDSMAHYKDCAPLVEGLGYTLVELHITPQKGVTRINAVIASKEKRIDGLN